MSDDQCTPPEGPAAGLEFDFEDMFEHTQFEPPASAVVPPPPRDPELITPPAPAAGSRRTSETASWSTSGAPVPMPPDLPLVPPEQSFIPPEPPPPPIVLKPAAAEPGRRMITAPDWLPPAPAAPAISSSPSRPSLGIPSSLTAAAPSVSRPAPPPATAPTPPALPSFDAPSYQPPPPTGRVVPLAPPPAEAPVTAPVLEEPDDDEVGATRNRAAALAAAAAAQMVSATQCSSSHFNPSYATTCRICGQAIPRQTPFMIPRPQLGQLRLSTGDVVPLDRGVLMGRAPRSDAVDRDRPHLIKLPSAENDISRMHVEVRLEGWHVIVTDLGSLNGTVVTRPGTPPETLRPHEGLTVEPGTTVTLADEISFRYEATA